MKTIRFFAPFLVLLFVPFAVSALGKSKSKAAQEARPVVEQDSTVGVDSTPAPVVHLPQVEAEAQIVDAPQKVATKQSIRQAKIAEEQLKNTTEPAVQPSNKGVVALEPIADVVEDTVVSEHKAVAPVKKSAATKEPKQPRQLTDEQIAAREALREAEENLRAARELVKASDKAVQQQTKPHKKKRKPRPHLTKNNDEYLPIFKVQISAGKTRKDNINAEFSFLNLDEQVIYEEVVMDDAKGYAFKYMIGVFPVLEDAIVRCQEIRLQGVEDAFVVASYKSKRITIKEATEIIEAHSKAYAPQLQEQE
ncbi:hypothetical protein AGMMS4956_19170 [Bacteroidia bacterium]|nr:hypothetical protein AGMMS4956_19170 [Bacteroidia bacterium]